MRLRSRSLAFCLALALAASSGAPLFGQQSASPALQALVRALARTEEPSAQLNILRGINAAMKGQRNVPPPEEWAEIYAKLQKSPNAELRQQAQALAVTFGGSGALDDLRKVFADAKAPVDRRKAALDSLVSAKDAPTLPLILNEVADAGPLRAQALRSLASYDAPQIPTAVLAAYPSLASEQKRDALAALTTRGAWARELLRAVDEKKIQRSEISAPLARQLQDLKDPAVDAWLAKNWGAVRTSSAEKQKEIARFKAFLTPVSLQKADPYHGRAIFTQTCAICHTLFGAGAKIGPELPGAFDDVDYLLQNVLDPNAIIGKDYQQTVVQTKDGQTLIGVVGSEEGATLTLKTLAGPAIIQRGDIVSRTVLDVSLMPEGLLTGRSEQDVRDLFAYLGRHGQVPMLADAANINDFFNGTDLTRWNGSSPTAWRVENGEIVGKGRADRAEFLTSDLVAGPRDFACELVLSGAGAEAEVVINGIEGEEGNPVAVFRIKGGKMGPAIEGAGNAGTEALWEKVAVASNGPVVLVVRSRATGVEVQTNDHVFPVKELIEPNPTVVSFRVKGEAAELRVRKLKLSLPPG